MQQVYVIGPPFGPFKVGRSVNPQGRLAELQTGNPQPLSIHCAVQCDDAQGLEARMHRRFAGQHLSGEWFAAELDELKGALGLAVESQAWQGINPATFRAWLAQMAKPPFHMAQRDCQAALGYDDDQFAAILDHGAGRATALACRAVLHRLEPYA